MSFFIISLIISSSFILLSFSVSFWLSSSSLSISEMFLPKVFHFTMDSRWFSQMVCLFSMPFLPFMVCLFMVRKTVEIRYSVCNPRVLLIVGEHETRPTKETRPLFATRQPFIVRVHVTIENLSAVFGGVKEHIGYSRCWSTFSDYFRLLFSRNLGETYKNQVADLTAVNIVFVSFGILVEFHFHLTDPS